MARDGGIHDNGAEQVPVARGSAGAQGGERVRWGEISEALGPKYNNLLGDVLLSSGVIAYLGPFTIPYRKEAIAGWQALCDEKRLPMSAKFDLQEVIGDPVQIRSWNLQGLPADELSIQNGILVTRSSRFPLLVDPQGQAITWLRNKEKERLPMWETTQIHSSKLKITLDELTLKRISSHQKVTSSSALVLHKT